MVRIRTDIKTSESYKPQDLAATNEGQNPFVRTTEKARQIGEKITAPKKEGVSSGRKMAQLVVTDELAARVSKLNKHWDEMELEDIAEEIVDLETRVSLLDANDPAAAKIQAAVQGLHFQFVFPITRELKSDGDFSFVQEINRLGKQIIQQNSLQPLQSLDPLQWKEVLLYAAVTA